MFWIKIVEYGASNFESFFQNIYSLPTHYHYICRQKGLEYWNTWNILEKNQKPKIKWKRIWVLQWIGDKLYSRYPKHNIWSHSASHHISVLHPNLPVATECCEDHASIKVLWSVEHIGTRPKMQKNVGHKQPSQRVETFSKRCKQSIFASVDFILDQK